MKFFVYFLKNLVHQLSFRIVGIRVKVDDVLRVAWRVITSLPIKLEMLLLVIVLVLTITTTILFLLGILFSGVMLADGFALRIVVGMRGTIILVSTANSI
jgi:hypothetical protein